MKQLVPEIVILALNTNNTSNELELLKKEGFEPIPVQGVYQNTKEHSYVVPIKGAYELRQLKAIATLHNQECILYANQDREASLHYMHTDDIVPIGTLTEVTKGEAITQGAYTYNPTTNQYWITR